MENKWLIGTFYETSGDHIFHLFTPHTPWHKEEEPSNSRRKSRRNSQRQKLSCGSCYFSNHTSSDVILPATKCKYLDPHLIKPLHNLLCYQKELYKEPQDRTLIVCSVKDTQRCGHIQLFFSFLFQWRPAQRSLLFIPHVCLHVKDVCECAGAVCFGVFMCAYVCP